MSNTLSIDTYKFILIVGLIIFIAGVIYPTPKTFDLKKELAILVVEVEHLSDDLSFDADLKISKNIKLIGLTEQELKFYLTIEIISLILSSALVIYSSINIFISKRQ